MEEYLLYINFEVKHILLVIMYSVEMLRYLHFAWDRETLNHSVVCLAALGERN